jgi:hypothetical protein
MNEESMIGGLMRQLAGGERVVALGKCGQKG